jgi:hypothetical protein
MKSKLILGVGLVVLLPGLCLAEKQAAGREQATRGVALAKIAGELMTDRGGMPARLTVNVEGADYLEVMATDRQGGVMVLEFEPNTTDEGWRPILPEDTEPTLFGRDLFSVSDLFMYQAAKVAGRPIPTEELLPFDATVTEQPYDDVSVFIVDSELMLIGLWLDGQRVGTYYAVNMDTAEADLPDRIEIGEDVGTGVLAMDRRKEAVCRKLGEWCTSDRYDLPTVIACIAWLVYCQSA